MGCGSSIHPSIYNETNKVNGIKPEEKPTQTSRFGDPRHLRGDYSQLQVTRHERNMLIKGIRSKTFVAANEMSGKIIEEREMLSLGTRSRGTSRNTSRAASPTQTKKLLQTSDDKNLAMSPVTENRATSNMSNRSKVIGGGLDVTAEEDTTEKRKKKSKKHKEKSKIKISADINQNAYNETEQIPSDVKAIPLPDNKVKPNKVFSKRKSKHMKHKKRKMRKSNEVEEISGIDTKGDADDSDDEQIENVAEANKTETDSNISQDDANNNDILKDVANTACTLQTTVPGKMTHVHFSEDISSRSRTNSTSELDTKRG